MISKLIKKVTFAAALAMFFCGASWAGTVTTEDVTLSLGGSPCIVDKASVEANWEPVMAESYIATSRWDTAKNRYVIEATGMDGETKIILKDKTGAENHLVFNVKVSTIDMTKHVIKCDPKGNTATVEVVSHYLVNHPKSTSRALFLGTLCSSHAGDADKMMAAISNAINAVANKATVDYHLYYDDPDGSWASIEGTVNQNERLSDTRIYKKIDSGHHSAMGQFFGLFGHSCGYDLAA